MNIDGEIAVQRQLVLGGIDTDGCQLHRDTIDGQVTIGIDHQTVGGAVVALHHIAAGQVEHSAAACQEADRCTDCSIEKAAATGADGGIGRLRCTGIQGQGHFNILDVILVDGENAILHIGALGAAPEVIELEQLKNLSAGLRFDGAGAGDIAPGIELAATFHRDLTAARHLHKADGLHRRACRLDAATYGCQNLGRNLHLTAAGNGQACALSHMQGAVGGGSRPCIGIVFFGMHQRGLLTVRRFLRVRDQQGHAAGNGVAAGKRTVASQHDGTAHSHQGIQIGGQDIAIAEICRCGFGYKHGIQDRILSGDQIVASIGGDNLIIRVGPGNKAAAAVCGGDQLCAGNRDFLRSAGGNRCAVYGHRAKRPVEIDGGFHLCFRG